VKKEVLKVRRTEGTRGGRNLTKEGNMAGKKKVGWGEGEKGRKRWIGGQNKPGISGRGKA